MQDYVKNNIVFFDEEDILHLAENQLPINNVVRGIANEAFGAWISQDDSICINYTFYDEKIRCMALFLPKEFTYKELSQIIFYFAMAVSGINNSNIIDTHNSYCSLIRSNLEKYGYSTFTRKEREELQWLYPHGFLLTKEPTITLPTIDKKRFYSDFFKDINNNDTSNEDKVYLMYDFHTDLTKIGYSKNPKIRERTLQSEKPDIILLTYWIADKQVEKELHKKYVHKRVRGEWFNLTFQDYQEIKEFIKHEQTT